MWCYDMSAQNVLAVSGAAYTTQDKNSTLGINIMKPFYFVLGAQDHEMQEIARICEERKLPYGFATVRGNFVKSHEAYDATAVHTCIPPGSIHVFVECRVLGLRADEVIDHHHEGDPGYGLCPAKYMEGSSLGQFLKLLGMEPTPRQRVIAAADHCLKSAYQGECPGVPVEDLARFRVESRARARGIPESRLLSEIEEAKSLLTNPPDTVNLAGERVVFLHEPKAEISEASARLGIPYIYFREEHGVVKSGIRSAAPAVVQEWMDKCGLCRIYGDPQRGFAGGYLRNSS